MSFLDLNKAWSNLAPYYNSVTNSGVFASTVTNPNVTNTPKPQIPATKDQFTTRDEGLIRGGALNVELASKKDFERISNFLYKSDKGGLFIIKQVGLQLSNLRLETEAGIQKDRNEQGNLVLPKNLNNSPVSYNPLVPTRIYNGGANTLAQVPANAFGIHIQRHGVLPLPAGAGYNYEKIARDNNRLSAQSGDNTVAGSKSYVKKDKFGVFPQATAETAKPGETLSFPQPGESKVINGIKVFNNRGPDTAKGKPTLSKLNADGDEVIMFASPEDAAKGIFSQQLQGSIGSDKLKDLIVKNSSSKIRQEQSYAYLPNRLLQNLNKVITFDVTNKGIGTNSVILSNTFGGPKSLYGIGYTVIKTESDQRTNITNNAEDPKNKANILNGFIPLSYSDISRISFSSLDNKEKTYIPVNNSSISSTTAETTNVEITYGVSHNGNKKGTTRKIDSINVIDITNSATFYSGSQEDKKSSEVLTDVKDNVAGTYGKDIIKFRIEFLNNDTQTANAALNAVNTDVLAFRAYIDDFNDGMTAKWNSYKYMGRGEDFYIYEGFTRDIGLAFTIYTHSGDEMRPIYKKLNYLMSTFTPDYNSANRMRGNIAYLTVGDYLYRQPGVFTDIKLSGMLDTHWEIGQDTYLTKNSEGKDVVNNYLELPKHIKVNLSFKPIHTFLPRKASGGTKPTFITPDPAYGVTNNYIN
jgi:hypothetical protein